MRRTEFTDFPFDKEAFKEMLIKARGERTQREFSKDCALSMHILISMRMGKWRSRPQSAPLRRLR